MATEAQKTELRDSIGETIPEGGSAADTLVTDEKIEAWIDGSSTMTEAALKGWEYKLAHWAGLVDVTDGAAMRALSDLMEHGQAMISYYQKKSLGTVRSRSRIGKIIRS